MDDLEKKYMNAPSSESSDDENGFSSENSDKKITWKKSKLSNKSKTVQFSMKSSVDEIMNKRNDS